MNVLFSAKLNKAGADMIGAEEGTFLSPVNKLLAQDVPADTFKAIEEWDVITGEGETAFWHVRDANKDPSDYTIQEAVFLKEDEFEAWVINPLKVSIKIDAPFSWFSSPMGWHPSVNDIIELPYDVSADALVLTVKSMVSRYGAVPVENISSYTAMVVAVQEKLESVNKVLKDSNGINSFPLQFLCKDTGLSLSVDLLPSSPNDFL